MIIASGLGRTALKDVLNSWRRRPGSPRCIFRHLSPNRHGSITALPIWNKLGHASAGE